MLLKTKNTSIGIMVSKKEVSIAAIENINKKYRLQHFMNANIINDQNRSLSCLIKKFRALYPQKIKSAVLGISSDALLTKNISLDANLEDADIYKFIQINTAKWFGASVSKFFIDYAPTSDKHSSQKNYRVNAGLKKSIIPLKKICKANDLKLMAIDSEPYTTTRALLNLLNYSSKQTVAAIILNREGLRLYVTHRNHITFIRQETYRKSIIATAYRALQYYLTSPHYQSLTDIILLGETTNARNLITKIKNFTEITPCIATIALYKKYSINFTPALLNACGAAMWRF